MPRIQLGALALAATLAGLNVPCFAQSAPPGLLTDALKKSNGLLLLDSPTDAKDLADLRQAGYWPPWKTADLDGDGKPDAVAVVKQGKTSRGVIAVHAKAPDKIEWVTPLADEPITGLAVNVFPGAVSPIFCWGCDDVRFFRWNGSSYEQGLLRVGERVFIPMGEPVVLHATPDNAATTQTLALGDGDPCLQVIATTDRSKGARWYRVRMEKPVNAQGWITQAIPCGR